MQDCLLAHAQESWSGLTNTVTVLNATVFQAMLKQRDVAFSYQRDSKRACALSGHLRPVNLQQRVSTCEDAG
jgi:hypothetical protein